jgi:molybdenum cofactor cytidylyltransferase
MPNLEVDTVRSLTSRYLDPLTILAIAYEDDPGRPAHPVLFGSAYRDELADLEGDEGARRILLSHRSHLQLVSMGGHLADIDQPTDAIKERDATGGGAPQSRRLRAPPENDHD